MRQLGGEIFRSVHPRSDKRPEYYCTFYCSTHCSPFRKQTSTIPVTTTVTVCHMASATAFLDAEYRRDFFRRDNMLISTSRGVPTFRGHDPPSRCAD
jgi:hypothetical protein